MSVLVDVTADSQFGTNSYLVVDEATGEIIGAVPRLGVLETRRAIDARE